MLCLDDSQDSFRELGGNEALLKCLENCETLPKDVLLKITLKVINENGKTNKQTITTNNNNNNKKKKQEQKFT